MFGGPSSNLLHPILPLPGLQQDLHHIHLYALPCLLHQNFSGDLNVNDLMGDGTQLVDGIEDLSN